jgi:phosphate transport system substrate-binding protein
LKSTILILLFLINLFNCKQKEVLTIAGSETMHETVLVLSNEFQKDIGGTIIDLRGGGSKLGIEALEAGMIDIAMVSRDLNQEEKDKLNLSNNLEEIVIGYDGAAIVVHPDNPISKIDLETASKIFRGEIQSWKEIGGDDIEIIPLVRNQNSGTAFFFKEHVVKMKDLGAQKFNSEYDYSSKAITLENPNEIISKMKDDKRTISYIGMGQANQKTSGVKLLEFARKPENEYISPNIENVMNRKYRLARRLSLVYRNTNKKSIDQFITYVTGEKGQSLVLKSGYLRSTLPEVEVKSTNK